MSYPEIPEHKIPSHDGMIWPKARRHMTQRAHIVDRMVEDIAAHYREHGRDEPVDLTRYGWTPAQCSHYRSAARSAYRDARHPIHQARRPLGAGDPTPISADMAALVEATRRNDLGGAA